MQKITLDLFEVSSVSFLGFGFFSFLGVFSPQSVASEANIPSGICRRSRQGFYIPTFFHMEETRKVIWGFFDVVFLSLHILGLGHKPTDAPGFGSRAGQFRGFSWEICLAFVRKSNQKPAACFYPTQLAFSVGKK